MLHKDQIGPLVVIIFLTLITGMTFGVALNITYGDVCAETRT